VKRRCREEIGWRTCLSTVCAGWLFFSVSAGAETPGEHLLALVESQDLAKIGAYLAQPGIGINDRPDDFKTLLDFAAERNLVNVAQYLIDHGADLNAVPQGDRHPLKPAGTTALCRAAYFNALGTMDLLIRRGADVNSLPGRASALIYAAEQGNLKAVEMLVDHGANINQSFGVNQTAISEAIQKGHVDVANYLAGHGATMGAGAVFFAAISGSPDLVSLALESKPDQATLNQALAEAAGNGRIDEPTRQLILKLLLAHGADPDAPQNGLPTGIMPRAFSAATAAYLLDHGANSHAKLTGYELAAGFCANGGVGTKDPLPLDRMLVARGMSFSDPGSGHSNPLTCAVSANRIDLIDFLVDHGANVGWPNWDGSVPIFFASTREVIEDLLKHGADINQTGAQVQKDGSLKPVPQMTPLSTAIQSSQWERFALLISMGADVHTQGGLFLTDVAVRGPVDIVTTLLDHGVDVNARGTLGETALLAAVRAQRQDRVRLLLDRGADGNVRGLMGQTALHLAVDVDDADMVMLLLARGADRSISNGEGITPLTQARTAEMRQLLGAVVPVTDGTSARDRADCATALMPGNRRTSDGTPQTPRIREPGEDWDYLDQVAGDEVGVTIDGSDYLVVASAEGGYLGRVDSDGVERIVCEYGKGAERRAELRPLTEYERLEARSQRDVKTISVESLQLQGVRGAVAILGASRRPHDPVPIQFNSDGNVLGDAAENHRDDILAYYLEHGVDPNLGWLNHPLVDGVHTPLGNVPALYTAVSKGSIRAVELLLSHGAHSDAAEAPPQPGPEWVGKPTLAVAVLHREAAVVEALLAHGANPDMPSGHGFPPGVGIYSGFHQVLGGEVNQWISDRLFKQEHQGPDLVTNAAVLFRHGAAPDPWLYGVLAELQLRASANGVRLPDAVLKAIAEAPDSAQVREVADGIRVTYPAVSELLSVALRFRDAPPCGATTALDDLLYCLPKSLHAANDELNAHYDALLKTPGTNTAAIRSDQRAWIGQRDQQCRVKELSWVTQAGWLAYVLSESVRAQCVLRFTRNRAAALPAVSDITNLAHVQRK
jgi:ankyrin repeat protein/uncharacterized protein YecT (DUF1311 family)